MGGFMKPIIGILGRVDIDRDEDQFFASYEKVRISVIRHGGTPILLLPTQNVKYYEFNNKDIPKLTEEEKEDLCHQLDLCDALLIPGGYRWFLNYDAFLTMEAIKRDMPVLGICAGMQMLGILFTGERIIVPNETEIDHYRRRVFPVHDVVIKSDTKLYEIIKSSNITVNSIHRYHLTVAPNYVINAVSEDGLIEGIELPDKKFVIGVQWHPEILEEEHAEKLLQEFINQAKEYQKKS